MKKFQSFWKTTKRILYENKNILSLIWKISPFWVIYSCFVQVYEGIYPIFNNFTTKLLIDSVSDSLEVKIIQNSVYFTLFLIITGTVLLHIILAIKRYIDISCIDRINMGINSKIMDKISEKPYYHFETPDKMDTIHRVREQGSSKCIQQFSTSSRILFYDLIFGIGTIIIMLNISWIICLLFVIVISIRYVVNIKIAQYNHTNDIQLTNIRRKIQYLFNLCVTIIFVKEIKIFNIFDWINKKYVDYCENYNVLHKKYVKKSLPVGVGSSIASTLLYVVSYYLIVRKGLNNDYTVGTILFYTSSLSLFSSFLESIIGNITRIYGDSLYTSDLFTILNEQFESGSKEKETLQSFKSLKITDVDFTYPGTNNKVLKNISLEINNGESICIVGRNGSGKSTLIKLILGLYDPDNGSITIDDIDIFDMKKSGKYYSSAVLQDYARYSFTLKENIVFDKNVDDNQVLDILKKVDFSHEEISKLPCSIHTFMNREYDENGIALSDGQWQRVAVARAFFQNTPIIILDEPTSNLDPISEDNLYNVISENKRHKTVIMVSHRFSGVINSDKIIVIDDGSIVGIGKHKELLSSCPIYKYMFDLQSKRYIEHEA